MVEAAGPVDGDVAEAVVEPRGAVERGARVYLAELEEAVEDGAVLAQVELLHLLEVLLEGETKESHNC